MASLALASLGLHRRSEQAQALGNLQEALGPLFPPKEASSPASGPGKSSTSRRSSPQALTNLEAALGGTHSPLKGPSEQQSAQSGARSLDSLHADGPSTAGFLDYLRSREEKPRTGTVSVAKTNAAPHKAAEASRSVDLHTRQFKQQLNNLQEALSLPLEQDGNAARPTAKSVEQQKPQALTNLQEALSVLPEQVSNSAAHPAKSVDLHTRQQKPQALSNLQEALSVLPEMAPPPPAVSPSRSPHPSMHIPWPPPPPHSPPPPSPPPPPTPTPPPPPCPPPSPPPSPPPPKPPPCPPPPSSPPPAPS